MKLSYLQQIKNIVKEGKRDDVLCILSEQNVALKKENIQLDQKIAKIQNKAKELDEREKMIAKREELNKLDHEKIVEEAKKLSNQQIDFCKNVINATAQLAYKYFDLVMDTRVYRTMPNRDKYSCSVIIGGIRYHIYKDRITVDTIREIEVVVHRRGGK